ncbi:hypothetical protein ACOSQ3_000486 [Xanthoceras sorbifolium]
MRLMVTRVSVLLKISSLQWFCGSSGSRDVSMFLMLSLDLLVMPNVIINNFAKEWMKAVTGKDKIHNVETMLIYRKPPDDGWVKLNVDRGRDVDLGTIYAGGVIRDSGDNWAKGFALKKKKMWLCDGS